MFESLENFIKVRSFLAGNVEIMLENLVARRESSKIDSEDLFVDNQNQLTTSIQWKRYPILKKLDLLIAEKDSLGLYVSGNPLTEYQQLVNWVRNTAGRSDIYLIILEKIKKIFTKSGNMMFALEICLSDQDAEGIVFPKNAMRLSGKFEEKAMYWVKGNIVDRSKNKKKMLNIDSDNEEADNVNDEGIQEYAELPKLAIEEIAKFEDGVVSLFTNEEIPMTKSRSQMLESIDWVDFKFSPPANEEIISVKTQVNLQNQSQNSSGGIHKLRLPNTVSKERLVVLKTLLQPNLASGKCQIQLEIQDSKGSWQKVKGFFWLDLKSLPEDLQEFVY